MIESFGIENSFISNINELNVDNIEKSFVCWSEFEKRIQEEKLKFEQWFEKIFCESKFPTQEQIMNEFDFEKYKKQKEYLLKEKIKLSKLIFSVQKIGARKVITFFGFRIKIH